MVTVILSITTCIVIIYYFFWNKTPYRWFFVPVIFLALLNILDYIMVKYMNAPITQTILLMLDIFRGATIIYYAALLYKLERER